MSFLVRIALLLVVGLPVLGIAQTADAPAPSSQPAPPPPLVTAPPEPSPAAQAPASQPSRGYLLPPEWRSKRPDGLMSRILAGTFLGTLGGAGGLVGGALLGQAIEQDCGPFDDVCSAGEIFLLAAPALLGTGLLSSLVVYGTGSAFHGEGALLPTMVGGFTGVGVGALLTLAAQSYAGILLIPPLAVVGAIIAYEISDSEWERAQAKPQLGSSRLQWTPVVGMTPRGGMIGGLVGRF